ncbi:transcriptional regulator, AraC family [Oceanospirillum linum]|nr:AraC-type DNA-binding protein [Oleiphilus messinensis]SMP29932.1 transcriptional regulator, AraC family [Oceanospirillum linum]
MVTPFCETRKSFWRHMFRQADQISVIGSWPLVISRALDQYHIDGSALLARVGIDQSAANQPETRYSLATLDRLWRLARNLSGDEAVGLTVARFVRPTSWHALGFAIWSSDTLMECFRRLAENVRMFADYADMSVTPFGSDVEVNVRLKTGLRRDQLASEELDAFIGTSVLTARHIYHPDFSPKSIWLSRPQPLDPTSWQRLFKCPVFFNASYDKIVFDAAAMYRPLLTASPELAEQNDALVADYLARLDRSDLIARLESLLLNHLPMGSLPLEVAAAQLNFSPRTFQRRLQEKGSSYQQVLDELRQKQALHWVRLNYLTIGEISYRLGFNHPANFTRAFKRWFDETPKKLRKNLLN